MKPNSVGVKDMHFNIASTELTTAALATYDGSALVQYTSVYAASATVRDDYEQRRFRFSDAGSVLVAGMKVQLGVFLSGQNTIVPTPNFLFQWLCSGHFFATGTDPSALGLYLMFGRKGTNETVVAGLNTLTTWVKLPGEYTYRSCTAGSISSVDGRGEIFALNDSSSFSHVLAVGIANYGATDLTLYGDVSLVLRKNYGVLSTFKPSQT